MSVIFDQSLDLSNTETHRLLTLYSPPEYVKQATPEQLCGDTEKQAAHTYANQLARHYPCHTKAATWLSNLFFLEKQSHIDPRMAKTVEGRLLDTAAYFGILPDVEEIRTKFAALENDEIGKLSDDDFALVWKVDGQDSQRHYTLRNSNEVKVAADWFAQHRDNFTYPDRRTIANKLLDKSVQFGADISQHGELLIKTAGRGMVADVEVVEMLNGRANLLRRSNADIATQLDSVAESWSKSASSTAPRDPDAFEKLAITIDEIDRATRLVTMYDEGGLERPEETIYKINEKMARDLLQGHVETMTGAIYEKKALSELKVDYLQNWLGSALADHVSPGIRLEDERVDIEKLAAVLPTLPRADAEMFDKMTASIGIIPLVHTKAAEDFGLSTDTMTELADQYQPATVTSDQQPGAPIEL